MIIGPDGKPQRPKLSVPDGRGGYTGPGQLTPEQVMRLRAAQASAADVARHCTMGVIEAIKLAAAQNGQQYTGISASNADTPYPLFVRTDQGIMVVTSISVTLREVPQDDQPGSEAEQDEQEATPPGSDKPS